MLPLLAFASTAQGAGQLDLTLDGDGKVVTDFGANDMAFGVAIQGDGKIVAAGASDAGPNPGNFALTRYHPDGRLDSSFGSDGRVVTDFGANDIAFGVAVQGDGKIVAAGASDAGPNPGNFALARYDTNGGLDASFGSGGRVVTDFGTGDLGRGVAIQTDGKIVVAGVSDAGPNPGNFALARYKADGALDGSFGGDGKVVTDYAGAEQARGVAIQRDGKIVAVGLSNGGANPGNFALARYEFDGTLDRAFDGDGRVLTDFADGDLGFGVAIQSDGKIVATGISSIGANPTNVALARYDAYGSLDPAFDGDGRFVTDFGAFDEAFSVAIQADGRIVTAGFSYAGGAPPNFALARYHANGGLDSSFDGDGKVVTDFGAFDEAFGVAIQADGRIVAAGFTAVGANPFNFALARYLPAEPRPSPTNKAQCKHGGYVRFGFRNQGQCVAFVKHRTKP
jgi:uncharacterized delta-60 repeat protein